jgi:hypothetical protein
LDTKEFLRNQQETKISEGYNLINGAKLWYQMMQTSWSRGHSTHTQRHTQINTHKLGLIGVWHKDNLYLGTNIIGNGDPHPTNIDSWTRSIRMTSRRQLFFDKSFFSSLENHGREIISPTHTHTHKVRHTRSFINLNCPTYMSGYSNLHVSFIHVQPNGPPLGGRILSPLTIDPNK